MFNCNQFLGLKLQTFIQRHVKFAEVFISAFVYEINCGCGFVINGWVQQSFSSVVHRMRLQRNSGIKRNACTSVTDRVCLPYIAVTALYPYRDPVGGVVSQNQILYSPLIFPVYSTINYTHENLNNLDWLYVVYLPIIRTISVLSKLRTITTTTQHNISEDLHLDSTAAVTINFTNTNIPY